MSESPAGTAGEKHEATPACPKHSKAKQPTQHCLQELSQTSRVQRRPLDLLLPKSTVLDLSKANTLVVDFFSFPFHTWSLDLSSANVGFTYNTSWIWSLETFCPAPLISAIDACCSLLCGVPSSTLALSLLSTQQPVWAFYNRNPVLLWFPMAPIAGWSLSSI